MFLGFDYYFRTIKLSIVDVDGGVGGDEKRKQRWEGTIQGDDDIKEEAIKVEMDGEH